VWIAGGSKRPAGARGDKVARRSLSDKDPKRRKPRLVALPGGVQDRIPPRAEDAAPAASPAQFAADKSLTFLSRLATEFTTVLSLSDLLEHVMRVLREETGFDSCSLALVDDHAPDHLVVRAASGIRENFLGLTIPRHKGLHGLVLQSGAPLMVPDMHADPRVFRRENRIRSGIYAPLTVGRRQIGVLSAHRGKARAFTQADLDLLTVVARYLTGAVEVARLHEQLKELAATDALTGLANRRCFLDRAVAEIARTRRSGRSLSIVLIDLDGFKAINDAHGHAKGDETLMRVAEMLSQSVRASDLAARFGGDEFVLMLPETMVEQAEEILSRLDLRDIPVPGQEDVSTHLTFSYGIAAFPKDGDDPERLLHAADGRLYAKKKQLYADGAPHPTKR
jgi:diguanylate cyclase (GGDEF)-like protein